LISRRVKPGICIVLPPAPGLAPGRHFGAE